MSQTAILHISDLHRDPNNPISNSALLNSLKNDRDRYTRDSPNVPPPSIVIVSGDIIQGVPIGTIDFEAELALQYREALDFLTRLADSFVAGDRQRVVLVPGNHDVSACHFMSSLQKIDIAPERKKELTTQLFSASSRLRWSWSDLELVEITDDTKYAGRLEAFTAFYSDFYAGTRNYSLDATQQFDVFDFPDCNFTIVGFSSCFNNDVLNKQGAIHPDCIAGASDQLGETRFNDRIRIAVWHHNTEGLPMQSDYMDSGILQNLIDNGFSLGFHGHQHRPQFLDTRFRYGSNGRITVISAGTLCGGASPRFGRAYNLVELDADNRRGRLHLREMQNDDLRLPIWGRRSLPPGTDTYLSFKFDGAPQPRVRPEQNTSALLEAQIYYDAGDYLRAAKTLDPLATSDGLARRLLLNCLLQLRDTVRIIAFFDPPVSSAEAISLIDALWLEGQRDRLRAVLAEPYIATSTDPSVVELREKYLSKVNK